MDASRRSRRMGAISLRTLGVGWPVGMDLGGRRALGICSLPLWTVGVRWRRMVLGAGTDYAFGRFTRQLSWRSSAALDLASESASGLAVAWFPLAPHEVFVPWYRTSPGYVNSVNITNTRVSVTQVTNVYNRTIINNNTTVNRITYVNQRVPSAVTAVSHDTFANARPVQGNIVHVDEKTLANAPVSRDIPVQPARQSVLGAGRPATARPPAAIANRQVVATRTPPAPRGPFEQRAAANSVKTETPGTPQRLGNPQPNRAAQPVNPRLEEQETPPREENAQPQPPQRAQAARPQPGNVPRPPSAATSHSLVRTAPPVQEHPEQQRSEEQKFQKWQQQRPPASAPKGQSHPEERPPHK